MASTERTVNPRRVAATRQHLAQAPRKRRQSARKASEDSQATTPDTARTHPVSGRTHRYDNHARSVRLQTSDLHSLASPGTARHTIEAVAVFHSGTRDHKDVEIAQASSRHAEGPGTRSESGH
jgi:hypothetical protein